MEFDVEVTRKDGSGRRFRLYGVPTPAVGDIVSLPIDGMLIKAQIAKKNGLDRVEANEI
jgi:hypothetical protein